MSIESVGFNQSSMIRDMEAMRLAASNKNNLTNQGSKVSFKDTLANAYEGVKAKQSTSDSLTKRFVLGDPNVSMSQVVGASQESSVAFETAVQVRNKLLDGFKEIVDLQL